MLGNRELVRVRRGRVVISQWVEQSSAAAIGGKSPQEPSDIEAERERVNARYRQLGGKGADPIRKASAGEPRSLGELIVSGDADRAARLQERTVPKTMRYEARGRVRLRLR